MILELIVVQHSLTVSIFHSKYLAYLFQNLLPILRANGRAGDLQFSLQLSPGWQMHTPCIKSLKLLVQSAV